MGSTHEILSATVEKAINQHINGVLYASYQYLAMSAFFGRPDIALPGATEYFKNQSLEERQHAQKLIDYVNDRGGKVRFSNIRPPIFNSESLLDAFQVSLVVEQTNKVLLLGLHRLPDEDSAADFLSLTIPYYDEYLGKIWGLISTISWKRLRLASEKKDPDLTNFLEEHYLRKQVIQITEMTRKANQLRRMGEGLGEHLFDRELVKEMKEKKSSKE